MTYSARETALRAEIEKQAPDLTLKYVMEWMHYDPMVLVSAAFSFPNKHGSPLPVLKGFSTTARTIFSPEDVDMGVIAAAIVGSARHWYEHVHPNMKPWQPPVSDTVDWANP